MNKRLLYIYIFGGLIFLLVLILIGIFVHDNNLSDEEGSGLRAPNNMGSYQNFGYYKIDPKTILVSLERGDKNVFTLLPENDALNLGEIPNLSIYWTQADFLKLASALGQTVWEDPMDLTNWRVYSLSLRGSCGNPIGFDHASITYFKNEGKRYVTRYIEIHPFFGWVRWGDGNTYPQPILQKWKPVDLARAKITADDALRTVNEDVKARFQIVDHICGVMVGSSRFDPKAWEFRVNRGPLDPIFYTISLVTGEIIRKPK
jgi:hypothetical protein